MNAFFDQKEFVLSGFDVESDRKIRDVIFKHGGKVGEVMHEKVAYLVTTPAEAKKLSSEKVAAAIRFGIPVVGESFVWQAASGSSGTSPRVSSMDYPLHQDKYAVGGSKRILIDGEYIDFNLDDRTGEDSKPEDILLPEGTHQFGNHTADFGRSCPRTQKLDESDIQDRFEWQRLLVEYLTGDDLESKKWLIGTDDSKFKRMDPEQLWLEIYAANHQLEIDLARQLIEQYRVDAEVAWRILEFRIPDAQDHTESVAQIFQLVKDTDECQSFYASMARMGVLWQNEQLKRRMAAVNAWNNGYQMLQRQTYIFCKWSRMNSVSDRIPDSFLENILREMGIQKAFNGRIIQDSLQIVRKIHDELAEFKDDLDQMNIPSLLDDLIHVTAFPVRLLLHCIRLRLDAICNYENPGVASNLHSSTIDQMISDIQMAFTMANETRQMFLKMEKYSLVTNNERAIQAVETYCLQKLYEETLTFGLKIHMNLLNLKARADRHTLLLKDPNFLDNQWEFLKRVTSQVPNAEKVIARDICHLTDRITISLQLYVQSCLKLPESVTTETEKIKWFNRLLENVRARSRKLVQFVKKVCGELETSSELHLRDPEKLGNVLDILKEKACRSFVPKNLPDNMLILSDNPESDVIEFLNDICAWKNIRETISKRDCHLVVICIPSGSTWTGPVVVCPHIDISQLDISVMELSFRVVCPQSQNCGYDFLNFLSRDAIDRKCFDVIHNHCSFYSPINVELQQLRFQILKLANLFVTSIDTIRTITGSIPCVDLIESWFSFASDFGYRTSQILGDSQSRIQFNRQLIELAMNWVTFTCSDCSPTDKKTFRWALMALDFVMLMTRGNNVLELTDDAFSVLRSKVACCMTLLISQFDFDTGDDENIQDEPYLHGNMLEEEVNNAPMTDAQLLNTSPRRMEKVAALEASLDQKYQHLGNTGKILDDRKPEDQPIIQLLASSSSQVTLRWQQGKTISSGTFGTVYLGINLETGGLMAVKEIRFIEVSSLDDSVNGIQREMSVLELVDHSNLVNYYGIEIHRDKCYIFMEYCEGGSLANLLENGSIEDESIVELYAFQILQGIRYLHEKNIIHRDIKPDNILFDYHGTIKLVDFGAAKILEDQQQFTQHKMTLIGTPNYMAPEVVTGKVHEGRFGSQDIWSFGCVVLEMLTGKQPWAHLDNEWAIMYHIGIGSAHPLLPEPRKSNETDAAFKGATVCEEMHNFLKKCFQSAAIRPSAVELIQDPIFTSTLSRVESFRRQYPNNPAPYPNPWLSVAGFMSNLHSPGLALHATLSQKSYFPTIRQESSSSIPSQEIVSTTKNEKAQKE